MVLKAFSLVLASMAVACSPEFEASFEPLAQGGAEDALDAGSASPANTTGGANQISASAGAGRGGVGNAGGASGGVGAVGGSGGVGLVGGSGSARGGAGLGSGGGAVASAACTSAAPWSGRAYDMSERATSHCKAPYNGACPAESEREFECNPPSGLIGLGWCSNREPGVSNGWQEAWLMQPACDP
jgi:hypothetical protein